MSEAGYVLIVDDSEGIRDALARDLRRLGHRCDTAANGRMGLEKLRESDFDVALIDLKMPEMGGLGLLRAMEEAGLTTVPVVLSGQAQIPEAVEATRRGAFDFIEKPADAETIRRTVGRALRHRRALCNARRMAGLAEQWEATFDAFPDMIVVLQPDCRIQQVNQAVVQRVGRAKEDLVSRPCHEALCGKSHPPEECPFTRDLPGEHGRSTELPQTAWGGHFEVSSVPLRDEQGQMAGSMHVIRDITARKLAEWELHYAHARAELLLASISSILICLHENGRITQWNDTAERTFAITSAKAIGQKLSWCGIEWEFDRIEAALTECTGSSRPVRVDDIRFRRPGGDEGFLAITANPMKAAGDDGGVLILGIDMTERKLLESQLAHAQKLEGIGQLAAGIAHEINTPMQYVGDNTRFLGGSFSDISAALDAYARLLAAAKDGTTSPEILAEVEDALEQADVEYLREETPRAIRQSLEGVERVTKIVRAMRDFSHPGVEEKTAIDINQAIESTVTISRNEWKYVAEMETDLDRDLPPVLCLAGELNQVILNLIVNASHAIADVVGDGSGGKGAITIGTRRDGDWVEIRVTDTGAGIPEGIRSRIFDPFFTTKQVGRGTGQGLSIAHAVVVDRHGGEISFETETGKGTSFLIRLPLDPAQAAKTDTPAKEVAHVEQDLSPVRG